MSVLLAHARALLRRGFPAWDRWHFAVFDYAAVSVVGVFAEANVGDYDQIQFRLANRFDGALNGAVGATDSEPVALFMLRQPNRIIPGVPSPSTSSASSKVYPPIADKCPAWNSTSADVRARAHEHRIDGAVDAGVFRGQRPNRLVAAQAARRWNWGCHGHGLLGGAARTGRAMASARPFDVDTLASMAVRRPHRRWLSTSWGQSRRIDSRRKKRAHEVRPDQFSETLHGRGARERYQIKFAATRSRASRSGLCGSSVPWMRPTRVP